MSTTATIEKPVSEVANPTSKTRSVSKTKEDDLNGVIAVIYRPERDKSVPSQIGLVPSIRQESLIYNLDEITQHGDLINKRTMPACDVLTLKVGANWVERSTWAAVKDGNSQKPSFVRKIEDGVFDEMPLAGDPIKSLTSYSERDAISIASATWSDEEVTKFQVDEKRPLVLQACNEQLRKIASQYQNQ